MRTAIQFVCIILAGLIAVTIPWSMADGDGANTVFALALVTAFVLIAFWVVGVSFPDDA